jgi:hypothetical protein
MVSFNSDLPHFSSSFSKKKNIVSLGFIWPYLEKYSTFLQKT